MFFSNALWLTLLSSSLFWCILASLKGTSSIHRFVHHASVKMIEKSCNDFHCALVQCLLVNLPRSYNLIDSLVCLPNCHLLAKKILWRIAIDSILFRSTTRVNIKVNRVGEVKEIKQISGKTGMLADALTKRKADSSDLLIIIQTMMNKLTGEINRLQHLHITHSLHLQMINNDL